MKQFVSQEVCLSCDGCCRFKEKQSEWRPHITKEEVLLALENDLAAEIFSRNIVDSDGRIKTKECQGHHFCSFFNPSNNTCNIYPSHPFECQLYPFVLTKEAGGVVLCVHHRCPFIQDNRHTPLFEEYVAYLKRFFQRQDVLLFLQKNPSLAGDYSAYKEELEEIFPLTF